MADRKHTEKPYRTVTPEELKRDAEKRRRAKKQPPVLRVVK